MNPMKVIFKTCFYKCKGFVQSKKYPKKGIFVDMIVWRLFFCKLILSIKNLKMKQKLLAILTLSNHQSAVKSILSFCWQIFVWQLRGRF